MLSIFMQFSVLLSIIGVLIFPAEVIETGKSALELSFFRVIPSLFPFFVLQSMAFATGLSQWLSKTVGKIFCFLFKIPDASPFILGVLGGYPIGFKSVVSLYENGQIEKRTAERMLGFCNNAGPAFIIGFVGVSILGDKTLGYTLVLGHFISSVLVGVFFSLNEKMPKISNKNNILVQSMSKNFISAINLGFTSCLSISGFIVFFSVVAQLLNLFGAINSLAFILSPFLRFFGISHAEISAVLVGFAEMTTGISMLNSELISTSLKIVISSVLLAFGGMSIHFQSFNFNRGLNTRMYVKCKILHAFLAPIVTIMLLQLVSYCENAYVNFSCTTDCTVVFAVLFLVALVAVIYFSKKSRTLAKK